MACGWRNNVCRIMLALLCVIVDSKGILAQLNELAKSQESSFASDMTACLSSSIGSEFFLCPRFNTHCRHIGVALSPMADSPRSSEIARCSLMVRIVSRKIGLGRHRIRHRKVLLW